MKKLDFLPNLRNRYSIRRFTVGTASILIGSLLFLGHNGEAKAAENLNDNNTVVEASNESSTSQQASVENNKTLQEKPVEATQQKTDNTAQTKNTVEEAKQTEPETAVHAVVEKAITTEQSTVQKEEPVQVQKTENSKESTELTVEKTPAATSTEAEPVKEEVSAEKAQPTVTENKATTEGTAPSTEPTVEKPVPVTETPALTPEQKVEKVKQDLSSEYDSAKVDEVLAVIDTANLTPEQLKSEVLRILLEQASAQKDLFSPQATLPRTSEEASSYSTRAVPTSRDKRKLDSAIASAEALGQLNSDIPDDKQIQEKLAAAKVIKADTAATQEQVQTATTELNAAVTQKQYNVTLQRLKDALAEAKKIDTTLYTPLSANAFETAINEGELRVADPKSTPTSLEKRITALETAKSSLILIPNKTELKKAIDKAHSLGALNYADDEDNGVGVQLDLASQVYSYSESSQTEVDEKTASLMKAINIKLYQDALERLNAAIKDAKTINQAEYTPATAVPFDNAIKAGDTQAADTSSSPEQLDAATKSIQETKAQLQRLADKTELNQAIQNAEGIGKLDITDTEDKALHDKLETAKIVVADNNATQDQVKTATNELNDAVKQKLYQDALDELNVTIQGAEKVVKDTYTPNSVVLFDVALAAGKMQAADTSALPDTLKTATKAIKDAKNALVQRADKTGLNQSITTAEGIHPLEAGNPEDDALKAALNNAKTVQGDLNTDQPTVDNTKIELDNAIKAKQDKAAQARQIALDELRTELTKAGGINKDGYTTSSTTRLTSTISAGNNLALKQLLKLKQQHKHCVMHKLH
ncbi:YSIRK-type signal peptide-containing protein [Staphylococcus simulans]|uniref:YSIRK-type signal peptide-containing protein n=1 Tax=Staphylococcus simulans TaxID=1286 RepID=UPI00399BE206